jgi:cold shock CspA family protein
MRDLKEGQKLSFDLQAEKNKTSAVNLQVQN